MKKLVNNKVVDITNIELFEKAFESMTSKKYTYSNVKDTIEDKDVTEFTAECIKAYNTMHRSLPFPLYAVEDDIKYATMGTYIKDVVDEPVKAWVDDGLYIKIEEDKAIKFIGSTWAIVTVNQIQEDNINIEEFRTSLGYNEFKWVLVQMMNRSSLKGFYEIFMKSFVEACNRDIMIMKWELARVLDIGMVPKKLEIPDNSIINLDRQSKLFMDIFSTGKKKTKSNQYVIRLGENNTEVEKRSKNFTIYDFELYEKNIDEDDFSSISVGKLKKLELEGVLSLFESIVGKGTIRDNIDSIRYKGIISENKLIYLVDGSLYISNANKYSKAKEIARNVDLYSFEKGMIYFSKRSLCDSGVTKEIIYSYKIDDGSIRICKIQFI